MRNLTSFELVVRCQDRYHAKRTFSNREKVLLCVMPVLVGSGRMRRMVGSSSRQSHGEEHYPRGSLPWLGQPYADSLIAYKRHRRLRASAIDARQIDRNESCRWGAAKLLSEQTCGDRPCEAGRNLKEIVMLRVEMSSFAWALRGDSNCKFHAKFSGIV